MKTLEQQAKDCWNGEQGFDTIGYDKGRFDIAFIDRFKQGFALAKQESNKTAIVYNIFRSIAEIPNYGMFYSIRVNFWNRIPYGIKFKEIERRSVPN